MSEKAVAFIPEMVKAVLERRKVVTRRLVNGLKPCRYKVGDTLYIRERWRTWEAYDDIKPTDIPIGTSIQYSDETTSINPVVKDTAGFELGKWRPSMFMPKWAARPVRLIVTNIRKERVQIITPEDCLIEGVSDVGLSGYHSSDHGRILVGRFKDLWDEIHGDKQGEAWSFNPEVHVIGFRIKE